MTLKSRLLRLPTTRTGVLVLTTGGNLVVRMVSTVLLTRLLSPEAFGIVGIVMAILFTLNMLTDLGFQSFVVRHERGDDPHFRNVIWTIHAGRGALLTVLAAATSPLIAWALGKQQLTLPLFAASSYFFLNGVASLSLITALRHDGARKLSLVDFGLQLFQTAVGLLLALWWRNVWSIIAAMVMMWVVRIIVSFVLFKDAAQRPARDRALSKEFLAFSRVVVMSSTLSLLIAQIDKLVLARLFTLPQFGLYAIALNIASAPGAFCDAYVTRVIFPVYAQMWRTAPSTLPSVYYRVRRLPSLLYAFGCGGLVGGAGLVVAVLYDPRYARASQYIALLAIASTLRLPNLAAAELMTAVGKIRMTLHANVVRVVWLCSAIPLGFLWFGPLGVVAAVGLMEVPAMVYSWFVLRRLGVLDLREELAYLAAAAAGGLIGYLVAAEALLLWPRL